VPCFVPCDTTSTVVRAENAQPGRRRRTVFVTVPKGAKVGDMLQTTTPDGELLQVRVPPRMEFGDRVCVEY